MTDPDARHTSRKIPLESLISYSGDAAASAERFDLCLFKALNAEYASKPVVPAPRELDLDYTQSIGRARAAMLERRIGVAGQRILEVGCGDGMLSRVLAGEFGAEVVGVDVLAYDAWQLPRSGKVDFHVHDIAGRDNAGFGSFDRVVSFAVFEHIVHPHAALKAIHDLLRPGGKAYIYANLYRGAKASHRYREVYFPWPHLLFAPEVWRAFYRELTGEAAEAAWVNKLTYDQYVAMAGRIGFTVAEHFPSQPYFDAAFYGRFEYELAAYPKFDLMHDFIHLVLEKPAQTGAEDWRLLLDYPAQAWKDAETESRPFWRLAQLLAPAWIADRPRWLASHARGASALRDAVPWISFPAIDFIDGWLTRAHTVFEWGSGGSTLFFSARAGKVFSVEHDAGWHSAVRERLAALPNTSFSLIEPEAGAADDTGFGSGARGLAGLSFRHYVEAIAAHPDGAFDLVSIDGRARMACLRAAIPKVAPGGLLLLDNANYPRYAADLAALRAGPLATWREIPLAGPGPYSRAPAWETVIWQRSAQQDVTWTPETVTVLREQLAGRPARSYDRAIWPFEFLRGGNWADAAAAALLADGHTSLLGEPLALGDTIDWQGRHLSRSTRLMLQGWDLFEPVFAMEPESDRRRLPWLASRIAQWLDTHREAPLDLRETRADPAADEDFVAADTAISSRLYRLAYLIAATAGSSEISNALFARMLDALERHADALMSEAAFSAHTNHGLLQAFAQVCAGSRFRDLPGGGAIARLAGRMTRSEALGLSRIQMLLSRQFGGDGSHLEHSAMYHVMFARAFAALAGQGLLPGCDQAVARMRTSADLLLDDTGRLAPLGDTDPGLRPHGYSAPVPERIASHVLPDGGYWIVKGPGSYLAQTACFHSPAHKQADTGAFFWRDRNRDILIDPGRYGYVGRTLPGDAAFQDGFWYADPRRRYVEGTRAHNTVMVDGRNHPRRRAKPFGPAVHAACETDGAFACESSVPNLPRLSHHRIVAVKPGSWLLTVDLVRARDGASHAVAQNFHLHPDWRLVAASGDAASYAHADGGSLHATPIFADAAIVDTARGRGDPDRDEPEDLFGWWSPGPLEFEPCESLSVSCSGDNVVIATLFSFAPVEIDRTYSTFNASRRRLRFRWTGAAPGRLTLDRGSNADGGRSLTISDIG
jgi:SAM-dependent methyltransferase